MNDLENPGREIVLHEIRDQIIQPWLSSLDSDQLEEYGIADTDEVLQALAEIYYLSRENISPWVSDDVVMHVIARTYQHQGEKVRIDRFKAHEVDYTIYRASPQWIRWLIPWWPAESWVYRIKVDYSS